MKVQVTHDELLKMLGATPLGSAYLVNTDKATECADELKRLGFAIIKCGNTALLFAPKEEKADV